MIYLGFVLLLIGIIIFITGATSENPTGALTIIGSGAFIGVVDILGNLSRLW